MHACMHACKHVCRCACIHAGVRDKNAPPEKRSLWKKGLLNTQSGAGEISAAGLQGEGSLKRDVFHRHRYQQNKRASVMYGFYYHFKDLRLKKTHNFNDSSAAHVVASFVSSEILHFHIKHPTNYITTQRRVPPPAHQAEAQPEFA